ncbi:TetR/AcrR family transcriptional regulator C-terminal domain-containing protein [soil metagenome]
MTDFDAGPVKYTRHSRDDVVAAALGILDEQGLPDLTMRRLAAKLEVQPSALYWHFENKQTLLASVADQIIGRARPASVSAGDWQGATRAEAFALRDALLAFRDSAEVVSSTLALGLGAGDAQSRLCSAIEEGGFGSETSAAAAAALLHFILGHVSHEQQRLQADSLGVVVAAHAAHPDQAFVGAAAGVGTAEAFDFGLTLLVGGLSLQARLNGFV